MHAHTHTHTRMHAHTHTSSTDLQQYSVVVDPVYQRVLMWSAREDSQHAGYRHWEHIHQGTLHTNWEWEGEIGGIQMGWEWDF